LPSGRPDPSLAAPPLQLILRKAQPKRLGAFTLTGPALAGLTEAYVAAINDGAVPTITSCWQVRAWAACPAAPVTA
jgi:hypothetical protein